MSHKFTGAEIAWAVVLGIPALMLLAVVFVLLIGLIGMFPVLLVWNHGLTTFLAATGLGTVSTITAGQAFWLATLASAVGGILHGTGGALNRKSD
jgi:hypothetical protein